MSGTVGLAIIGAGPAGMSAAIAARKHGADVLVLDEQAAPGGQIYRNVETVTAERPETAQVLGRDYTAGAALVRAFRKCGAEYSPRTSVWELSPAARREDARAPLEIGILRGGGAEIVRAHCVIVASGAQERAVPGPGATLPGVMGAGGAQSLMKSAGLVPGVPVVIAGSGPLVYLVAWQLVRAGAPVRAVLLTMPDGWMGRAAGTLPEALAMPGALFKGIGWRRALTRKFHRFPAAGADLTAFAALNTARVLDVPTGTPARPDSRSPCEISHLRTLASRIGEISGLTARGVQVMPARDLVIEGRNQVESVRFRHRGREHSIPASLVLLHEGVIPNAHLTLAAGLDHAWDGRQHAFRPVIDAWGRTSEPGVLVAGDGARILGAEAAVETGRIAGFEAAYRLGRIGAHQRDALARPHRAALARHRRFREFLDLTFEPGPASRRPSDPTVTVCRCEEVTVAEIERVIGTGCPGPNQAKAFTRCGMGPCQGRMCATVVSEIFAERQHIGVGAVGHCRIRPPVKPVTVGELAGLEEAGAAPVDRLSTPIGPKQTPA